MHLITQSQSVMEGLVPSCWELVNLLILVSWIISIEPDLRLAKVRSARLMTLNSRSI